MGDINRQSTLREILRENYTAVEQTLEKETLKALERSYSPYSNFPVSCVLLLNNGQIVHGANQENAAYPSGLCAERVALFSAFTRFPEASVTHLAIALAPQFKSVPYPCGACLQVMAEMEQRQEQAIQVCLITDNKMYCANGVKNFLPFAFEKGHLKA
mgnify:CR=1 FL=1